MWHNPDCCELIWEPEHTCCFDVQKNMNHPVWDEFYCSRVLKFQTRWFSFLSLLARWRIRLVLLKKQKRNRVCLQVWSKPTNNNNNNNNSSALKKGKMFISFPRFSVFSQLDKFPVVQTNHHVKVCHLYDVLIVCEFRCASRTQSKCFSSCFCYLKVLNRSCLLWNRVRRG